MVKIFSKLIDLFNSRNINDLSLSEFVPSDPHLKKGSKRFYADEMLRNPIYQEVIDRIETDCIRKWRSTPSEATAIREQYYLHLRVLKQIDQYIRGYIQEVVTDQSIIRQV
jgi:hypothetical protein